MKVVYFGVGCFWGGEAYFRKVKGIKKVEVGYANGNEDKLHPTYEEVCQGKYNFVEVVKIEFDETIISFELLFKKFYSIINPFSLNKQGNDIGVQYKSLITSTDKTLIKKAKLLIKEYQKKEKRIIRIKVELLKNYFKAEAYHQNYLKKNPFGYCHIKLD